MRRCFVQMNPCRRGRCSDCKKGQSFQIFPFSTECSDLRLIRVCDLSHSGWKSSAYPQIDRPTAREARMYETIILAVCLTQAPSICKEVNISVEPDPTGSLQLPFHCARRGQMEAQKWIEENSAWHVERWSCHPYGKLRFKI